MHLLRLCFSAVTLMVFTGSAALAQPLEPLPRTVTPLPITEESYPFNSAAHQVEPIDLPSYSYTEEEFLVSGRAQVYDWTPNGNYKVTALGESDYTTRIMVRRPADASRFSGRVAMEVINMSADYDWTAMWAALWERVVANGDIYVGITSKPNVFRGLVAFDPERYERLSMPSARLAVDENCTLPQEGITYSGITSEMEIGLAWDMLTQIGALLKSDSRMNPLGSVDICAATGSRTGGNLIQG